MHSSFTSKLTYTKALYCFSSAWLFAQGANCNGFRNEWSRGRQPLYYIIHNSPDGVGNERSRQATALVWSTRKLGLTGFFFFAFSAYDHVGKSNIHVIFT